jgi:hypothetical protein
MLLSLSQVHILLLVAITSFLSFAHPSFLKSISFLQATSTAITFTTLLSNKGTIKMSSSPLLGLSRSPSVPVSPSFQQFLIEADDTVRVDTHGTPPIPSSPLFQRFASQSAAKAPVAVAVAVAFAVVAAVGVRRSARLSKPTTKATSSSAPVAPTNPPAKRRGRPPKVKTEEPIGSNDLNDSDVVAATAVPTKRGRGRPPKRKAPETEASTAPPAAKKLRRKAPVPTSAAAIPNHSPVLNDSGEGGRTKRATKPSLKAIEAAKKQSGEYEEQPAPELKPRGLSKRQKQVNKKRGWSEHTAASLDARVHAVDHSEREIGGRTHDSRIPPNIHAREFEAVLPEPCGRATVNDRREEEKDKAAVAAFYENEMSVTHHPDRRVYKPAKLAPPARGAYHFGGKSYHHTPELEKKNTEGKSEEEKRRDEYQWDSRDPHHGQAPESSCR